MHKSLHQYLLGKTPEYELHWSIGASDLCKHESSMTIAMLLGKSLSVIGTLLSNFENECMENGGFHNNTYVRSYIPPTMREAMNEISNLEWSPKCVCKDGERPQNLNLQKLQLVKARTPL